MRIKMLKATNFARIFYTPGMEVDMVASVAKRWIAHNIAAPVEVKPDAEDVEFKEVEEVEEVAEVEEVDYDSMSAKALFALCKDKGIELDKEQISGKTSQEKKDYLIKMLSA